MPALAAAAVTSRRARTAGVHDRFHAGIRQHLEPVGEREERIGCGDRALDAVTCPLHGQLARRRPD